MNNPKSWKEIVEEARRAAMEAGLNVSLEPAVGVGLLAGFSEPNFNGFGL